MAETCTRLAIVDVNPSSDGYEGYLGAGRRWVHLRLCMRCGHLACCDNSPNHHATTQHHEHTHHPIIRSCIPAENWSSFSFDELLFERDGAPAAPWHA